MPSSISRVKRLAVALCLSWASAASAQEQRRVPPSIDRVVVRWSTRSSTGVGAPHFITARELAFEARVEALAERRKLAQPFSDKHVRAAIQRHITEVILMELPVEPKPDPKDIGRYAEDARVVIEQQVGGRPALLEAAKAEGITAEELNAMLRRRARASYYLDKMVAPMLEPSELDLREAHRRGDTPYTGQRFEEVQDKVRNWYVSTRLRTALDSYFRNVRSKVTVQLIVWPKG
jgi:hypothetical protein